MYRITSITQNGVDRTDGRYPLRIGCVGNIIFSGVGRSMFFEYAFDASDNRKEGMLQTSTVKEVRITNNRVYVTTLNSDYVLEIAE